MKKSIALIGLVALLFGSQAYAAGDVVLCTLADQCLEIGRGINFGRAGRVTFLMEIPGSEGAVSCSATPSVQIQCKGETNWEDVTGALLIYGGLQSFSTYQPSEICRGVIGNATTDCTDFRIKAVAN